MCPRQRLELRHVLLLASYWLAGISRWGQSKLLVVSKKEQRRTDNKEATGTFTERGQEERTDWEGGGW